MSVNLNYTMNDRLDEIGEKLYAYPMARPLTVTVVGVMLLIAAAVSILGILAIFTIPLARYGVEQNYQSVSSFVCFSLAAAGLTVSTGYGVLTRRTWGRLMYLIATPVYLAMLVAVNGVHQSMALNFLSYGVFAFMLNFEESVEYFTRPF